jgi:hypothetical protein
MGTYGLKGVIRGWDLGELTSEQAIGQILLLLTDFHERLTYLEQKLEKVHRREASVGQPNHEPEA